MTNAEKIIFIIFFVMLRLGIFLLEIKVNELKEKDGEQE